MQAKSRCRAEYAAYNNSDIELRRKNERPEEKICEAPGLLIGMAGESLNVDRSARTYCGVVVRRRKGRFREDASLPRLIEQPAWPSSLDAFDIGIRGHSTP